MKQQLEVALIGEFDPDLRYHTATNDALLHAAGTLGVSLKLSWISTRDLDEESIQEKLETCHAVFSAPGDFKNMDGGILAIRYARERRLPFLGT